MTHFIRLYRLWSKTKRNCEAEEIYSFFFVQAKKHERQQNEDLGQMKMGEKFRESLNVKVYFQKPGKNLKECTRTFL